jgi:hypothetical protein
VLLFFYDILKQRKANLSVEEIIWNKRNFILNELNMVVHYHKKQMILVSYLQNISMPRHEIKNDITLYNAVSLFFQQTTGGAR